MSTHDTHTAQDAALATGIHVAGTLVELPADLDPGLVAVTVVRNVRRRRVATAVTAGVAALGVAGLGVLGALGVLGGGDPQPLPGSDQATVRPSDGASAGPERSGSAVGASEVPVLDPIDHEVPAGWQQVEHDGLSFAVPEGWTSAPTDGDFGPGVEWTGTTVTHVNGGVDPESVEQPFSQDMTEEQRADAMAQDPQFERVYVQSGEPGGNWWAQTMSAPESQLIDVPGADYAEVQPSAATMGGVPVLYSAQIYLHQGDRGENLFLVVEFEGSEQGWADLHAFLGSLDFGR